VVGGADFAFSEGGSSPCSSPVQSRVHKVQDRTLDSLAMVGSVPTKLWLRGSSPLDDELLGGLKDPSCLDIILFLDGFASWERRDVQQLVFCYDFEKLKLVSNSHLFVLP
jgi:hypothetical protein